MKYEQIAELLNGIAERVDWDKIMEGDNIIGLKQVKSYSIMFSKWEKFSEYMDVLNSFSGLFITLYCMVFNTTEHFVFFLNA